jgi:phenylpropionate dioxygenase-like ring-hydroxylating dioxygenase large terminal subunit
MNYLLNAWYPVSFSRDIDRTPKRRTVTEQHVVLYRKEDGSVVALQDLCPHRFTPLSLGTVKNDTIQCGYHGMTFDGAGRCVRIPGQDRIPAQADIRSYPVRENLGLVWVWAGDPAVAERTAVFDLPQYHDKDNWTPVHGESLFIGANYLNLADNLTDPAHVNFVHLSTLGSSGASEEAPIKNEQQGSTTIVYRWTLNSPPIPLMQTYFDGMVDRWQYYYYHAPSIAVIDFGTAEAGLVHPEQGDRSRGKRFFSCHFITPVDQRTCVDHWLHVRNFALGDDQISASLNKRFAAAFNEDKVVLEAIQQEEDRLDGGKRPLRIAIDGGVVRMRRLIDGLISAEARADIGSPSAVVAGASAAAHREVETSSSNAAQ